ncbi:MAG: HAD-IB family hydrolase [Geodermatophilaceae bacterium]|nr:HAD-IB family hydrolase [Geodermatophilaceae bacterium]
MPWRQPPDERRRQVERAGSAAADAAVAVAAIDISRPSPAPSDVTGLAAPAVSPPPEPDPSAAAFFDVDNTMMVGASMYHFAKGLAARRFFNSRTLARFAVQQVKFRIRGFEDPEEIRRARENALSFARGVSVEEIVRLGQEIYDEEMADRIWAGTRAIAQEHLDAGQQVWLVTATPIELAQIIAARLGLTGALGTVSEIRDGRYTGRLVGEMMHGPVKAEAVRALAAREGLNLVRCSAYGDSVNDLPMLSLVGNPVAVNPDSDLKAAAREQGWQVRDFRSGRKAAQIGVPTALGAAAVAGGVIGGIALRKRLAD